jgi:putative ABC transport system permease protein
VTFRKMFSSAMRLAWRQMTFERGKLVAAILGVMFACVLVFMQLGFKDSLYASISIAPKKISGDLFIVHKQTEALWRTVMFPKSQMMRALAAPEVLSVTPLYIGQGQWKNPETNKKRTLLVWGSEPREKLLDLPDLDPYRETLSQQDTAAFDRLSRPEFGPVEALLTGGSIHTEINDRKTEILTTFSMGASFAADGNLVTSDQNFFRIFPTRSIEQVDVGVLRLQSGSDIIAVQQQLKNLLDENVNVFTKQELDDFEFAYWQNNAPIGFIFNMGMIMGLVVGMIIVYQILFTDITNHLHEFATLKAMGYSHKYLITVVFCSSLILAVIGFTPGLITSYGLYSIVESAIFVPMPMPLSKIIFVFGLILVMCIVSGALAMRKMRSANPADMF